MIRLHVCRSVPLLALRPKHMMTSMVFQAGVETRSAMACYVALADYTASADKAYADAEPTMWRMEEWSFLDRRRETWP